MARKILIIEDQASMRKNLAFILEMEGYQTCSAANGREGLHLARTEKPDLVLCDIMMPELDGHGVVQALRQDPAFATTPFIFLTAKSDRNDIRIGMKPLDGANNVLGYCRFPVDGGNMVLEAPADLTTLAEWIEAQPRAWRETSAPTRRRQACPHRLKSAP